MTPALAANDDTDVPAAVFCIQCGRADCVGCVPLEKAGRSGGTPWEEPSLPVWKRLWHTARLSALEGETFFGGLGDGSLGAAFGFALTCELLAIGSLALAWLPVVYAFAPSFVSSLFVDESHRRLVVLITAAAVPLLAVLMVALHVLWACGLELGLRMAGATPRLPHCLRYALYSCGWDLVTSPAGFAAGCVASGVRGATAELHAAVRIPRFATVAYVAGSRQLGENQARAALRIAVILTGSIVLFGAAALGVGFVALMT
jgi:hypothetical protein